MFKNLAPSKFWERDFKHSNLKDTISKNKTLFFLRDCVIFSSLQFEFFLKLLPKYLKKNDRVIEIGSGPGRNLVIINKMIGCKVFGVENSPKRYSRNRDIFKLNEIPLSNVTKNDFNRIQKITYYDCVISQGFIEHYSDPVPIISAHSKLIKKGGVLVCTIPNFTGINFLIQGLLDKNILSVHNLKIMQLKNFKTLFTEYETLHCGYIGIFSGRIFSTSKKSLRLILLIFKPLKIISNILLIAFSTILDTSKISTGPYLIFIGKKIK